ncbi:hypothetical protein O1L60_07805 [Streptomyces diastatochromogenes]|nr:hypothetical protein [Streptomyces diastatochromogenes]
MNLSLRRRHLRLPLVGLLLAACLGSLAPAATAAGTPAAPVPYANSPAPPGR